MIAVITIKQMRFGCHNYKSTDYWPGWRRMTRGTSPWGPWWSTSRPWRRAAATTSGWALLESCKVWKLQKYLSQVNNKLKSLLHEPREIAHVQLDEFLVAINNFLVSIKRFYQIVKFTDICILYKVVKRLSRYILTINNFWFSTLSATCAGRAGACGWCGRMTPSPTATCTTCSPRWGTWHKCFTCYKCRPT